MASFQLPCTAPCAYRFDFDFLSLFSFNTHTHNISCYTNRLYAKNNKMKKKKRSFHLIILFIQSSGCFFIRLLLLQLNNKWMLMIRNLCGAFQSKWTFPSFMRAHMVISKWLNCFHMTISLDIWTSCFQLVLLIFCCCCCCKKREKKFKMTFESHGYIVMQNIDQRRREKKPVKLIQLIIRACAIARTHTPKKTNLFCNCFVYFNFLLFI